MNAAVGAGAAAGRAGAVAARAGSGAVAGGGAVAACAMGEPVEPRPDRGERPHKAARPQQLAPPAAARGQVAVEVLLVDFVAMRQPIGGAPVEGPVRDVLAQDSGAVLVAAAEQIAAMMATRIIGRRPLAVGRMFMLMRHDDPLVRG